MVTIFDTLAEKVKRKEIKQVEIARELKITPTHISEILRGQRRPSETLIKLAEIIYGDLRPEHPNKKIQAMIKMAEAMDPDTQQSALDCIEKEKWIAEIKKERQGREAA